MPTRRVLFSRALSPGLARIAWIAVLVLLSGCPRSHVRGHDAGPQDATRERGEPCGDVLCGEGLLCCNASCNLCTPPDHGCIAVVCDDD